MRRMFGWFGLLLTLLAPLASRAGSDEFAGLLGSLNVKAEADLGAFKVKVGAQFGVPVPRVEAVLAAVATPADAYMCFKVAEVASKPPEVVVREYQANKGKGWGAIAKSLGIKPGSAEFHALKKGDLDGGGDPGQGGGHGKGQGKGKGKK